MSAIHVEDPISWADEERDLTAWLGNDLQDDAFDNLYSLEEMVRNSNDPEIQKDWCYLQTSDHFYYMCTKWFSDGDVHKYFNPYGSPYEAYINYMNVLADFQLRLQSGPNQEAFPAIKTPAHKIREAIKDLKKPPAKTVVQKDKKTRKAATDVKKPGKTVKKTGKK